MKNLVLGVSAVGLLSLSSLVFAQATCEPAGIPIQAIESNMTYSGSTCDGVAGVPLGAGGTRWPTVAFTFTAQDAAGSFTLAADEGMEFRVFANACGSGDPAVSGYVTAGELLHVPPTVGGLADGTDYVMILTMDSTMDPPNPDDILCGDYTLTTPTLPVELQSFSVD